MAYCRRCSFVIFIFVGRITAYGVKSYCWPWLTIKFLNCLFFENEKDCNFFNLEQVLNLARANPTSNESGSWRQLQNYSANAVNSWSNSSIEHAHNFSRQRLYSVTHQSQTRHAGVTDATCWLSASSSAVSCRSCHVCTACYRTIGLNCVTVSSKKNRNFKIYNC